MMQSDAAFPAALLRHRALGIGNESDTMPMTFHVLQLYAEDIELRLHDMVEVVGVYQYVPDLAALDFGGMTLEESEQLDAEQSCKPQPIPGLVSWKTTFLSSCKHIVSLSA